MKILYDHQILAAQKVGGISRYFCEIISGLHEIEDLTFDLALKYSNNEYINPDILPRNIEKNRSAYEDYFHGLDFKGKWALYKIWRNIRKPLDLDDANKRLSIEALQAQDFDIFHPTYYDDYFLPYLGAKPFVLTVYDMIHELYPEYFSLSDQTSIRKRKLAEKSNKIIAISEHTKRDLIQIFDIPSEKIQVIHLASSIESSLQSDIKTLALPEKYLLFVGTRTGYKNFYFLVNGLRSILENDQSLHIVCAGSSFNKNELAFFEQQGILDRVHSYQVNDEELKEIYKCALVFIFPSLYEGFGLPVLEAFACGCPTVLSNVSSLPEIGGDAALYFEPKDMKSMQNVVSQVLYDDQLRADLIRRGSKQAQNFSWKRTNYETVAVYRHVSKS